MQHLQIKKLAKTVNLNSLGEPMTAKLVKRESYKAIYLRDDGYYEVFKIRNRKAEVVFGKKMPAREIYPSPGDFGLSAWCTSISEKADKIYSEIMPPIT